MQEIYIVDALRTPFGAFGGALAEIPAPQLAATVIRGLLAKYGLAKDAIDEVIIGQVLAGGCGQAPARQAMRLAGLPDRIPALTINKVCGSGLKALMLGADSLALGHASLVIAGGMENMSLAPYLLKKARNGYRLGHGELLDLLLHDGLQDPESGRHMGELGDASAARCQIGRTAQDAFAARSYLRAQTALEQGLFAEEIVAVVKQSRQGEVVVSRDEEPFRGDITKLPTLRPAFSKDGTITAGNASTINDGAALALLTDAAALKAHNLTPKARIVAMATESRHPDLFPEAPVGAIKKVCARAGLTPAQIDLFEINEAFASVPLIAIQALGLDPEKVNVNGGACALGHPIGASGARLIATLLPALQRQSGRYGLATLCIGGGEAVAMIIERL